MFGLDARIALAIFGALSVITGAALYGAMKEAKVVALITEFDNIDKAVTEYLLNTGSYPPADTTNATVTNYGYLNIKELITSTASSWSGPYLKYNSGANTYFLDHPNYGNAYLYRNQDSDWDTPSLTSTTCLSGSTSCSIYICIDSLTEDISKALDLKIDGVAGSNKGSLRYYNNGTFTCKKGMPYDKSLSPASIP